MAINQSARLDTSERLAALIQKRRLPHALLFCGHERQTMFNEVLAVAKGLFCPNGEWGGCGYCVACQKLEKSHHPDYVLIQPKEKTISIKIDDIRDGLIARANYRPYEAPCHVFCLEPAEAMTEDAQSAFLKTLEEPQGRSYFILITTHPERLLDTIRSRTQFFYFGVKSAAKETSVNAESVVRALVDYSLLELRGSLSKTERSNAIELWRRAPELSGLDRPQALKGADALIEYYRICMLSSLEKPALLGDSTPTEEQRNLARLMPQDFFIERIEILMKFREMIAEHANLKLALNVLWDRLRKQALAV